VKKQNKQSNVSEQIENWLVKLAAHFNVELGEEQVDIFTSALRENTRYQIDEAFNRCLNECQFMPKLSDVHQKMPEEKQDLGTSWNFVLNGPSSLDRIRPIAEEICKDVTGREYKELDHNVPGDARLIHDLLFQANRIRYARIRINTHGWPRLESLEARVRKPRLSLDQQKNVLREKGYLR